MTGRRAWLALVTVLAAGFLHVFDGTVVSVAVATIAADLGGGPATAQWLVAGYTVPFAAVLITAGRLGDALGQRVLVVTGTLLFAVASALCATADGPAAIITGRALQGLAAGLVAPQVFPVIAAAFPARRRPMALGLQAAVITLATVTGPIAGGVLAGGPGWRWVFLLSVPVALGTTVAALVWLPGRRQPRQRLRGLDPVSTGLLVLGLVALVTALIQGRSWGWSGPGLLALAAGPLVLLLVVGRQRRREAAGRPVLFRPSTFADRRYRSGTVANLCGSAGVAAFFLIFPLVLQGRYALTPAGTGLLLCAWSVGAAAGSLATLRLGGAAGVRAPVRGAAVMAAGLLGLTAAVSVLAPGRGPGVQVLAVPLLAVLLAVAGAGMGTLNPTLYNLTLSATPVTDRASGAGLYSTAGQLGAAVGVAAIGAAYFGAGPTAALAAITGCFALATAATALGFLRDPAPRRGDEATSPASSAV